MKYWCHWRTVEKSLIKWEINLHLTWYEKCFLEACTVTNQGPRFKITDTKLYVPVVTLSTQDNAKLFKQPESDLKLQLAGIKFHLKQQHRHKTDI